MKRLTLQEAPGRAGGALNVGNTNAVVNFYSGNIAGNRAATYGGGVGISAGRFNLYGGSIVGNTQYWTDGRGGGGVAVLGGTFNMYGGSVSDNVAATKCWRRRLFKSRQLKQCEQYIQPLRRYHRSQFWQRCVFN